LNSDTGRAAPAPPSRRRVTTAAVLLAATLLVVMLAAWIAVHGRIDYTIAGRHHALRRVTPVSLGAWLLLLGAAAMLGREHRDRIIRVWQSRVRAAGAYVGLLLAVVVSIVALAFGAFTAAGADPYGYVSQASLWAAGNPVQPLPLIALDAPGGAAAFCPLGYTPGAAAGTMVPTYAPGLPLQMAILIRAAGARAGFWAVPVLAGLAVWLTYSIGRRFMPPEWALVAALCTACSPVFVFQMLQPMSDVPVTAWWLVAVALCLRGTPASAVTAGLAASLAIATRPNIVPLVLPVALFLGVPGASILRARRLVLLFLAGCAPGAALVAITNHIFYGSVGSSGYGAPSTLYHLQGAAGTAWRYLIWLWDTHSVLILLPALLPYVAASKKDGDAARLWWCVLAFFAVLLACYAPYIRFDQWTYLRFLLPAIPLLIVAAAIVLHQLTKERSPAVRFALLGFVALMFPFAYVHTAAKGDAFALKPGFVSFFERPAAFARERLPPNAVFIALTQSGSLRYYGGRSTLHYGHIPPDRADALVEYLTTHGLSPWAALDRQETADFDDRFRGTQLGTARLSAAPVAVPPEGRVVFYPLVR
jgi:hypothetical protein